MIPQLLLAATGGALASYIFDPDRGKRRRTFVRDKFVHYGKLAQTNLFRAAQDLRYRTRGALLDFKTQFDPGVAPDDVLVARVRSKVGRYVSNPSAINVGAEKGTVILTGDIYQDELENCVDAIQFIPGVKEVQNQMNSYTIESAPPSLQGRRKKRNGEHLDLFQENWAPSTRLLATAAGVGFTLGSIVAPRAVRIPLIGLGFLTITRAASNRAFAEWLGLRESLKPIHITRTIDIEAPVEKVYAYWENYENFARFMSHIEDVQVLGEGRTHWIARGPAGARVEWDSIVTQSNPHQSIAWRTEGNSKIHMNGLANFFDHGEHSRLEVHLRYSLPGGIVGRIVSRLFGVEPDQVLSRALISFKSLMEGGKTHVDGNKVLNSDLSPARKIETETAVFTQNQEQPLEPLH